MNWKCIGYDLRTWPWGGVKTVDGGEWQVADAPLHEVRQSLGINENLYQLLTVEDEGLLKTLVDFVLARSDCDLIAIEIPRDIAEFWAAHLGREAKAVSPHPDLFACVGLDVCDPDGLFSVLHHPYLVSKRGGRGLFGSNELLPALECVQLANFVERGHAPLSIARISTARR